ncbi:Hypothetical protein (Fragment) [Durusdinium trenchii]|uniref:DNA/RNA-binding protein Alba-like domain-containing protein n=1 Tax=Durusdinium trenchii TaxID=1381693 RepID=A0ABP0NQM7_9DINO
MKDTSLTVVSGGRNPIREYVKAMLDEAASREKYCVLLRARLKAISKAISVAEVAARCATEQGLACSSQVELLGMREEGPNRRQDIQMEIRLTFQKTDEAKP